MVVDDDSEDHSLMELTGDMLEEWLDETEWDERRELAGGAGLFFVRILEVVLGIDPAVSLPVFGSTFFLETFTEDFTLVSEEQLLELLHDEDGLVGSVFSAVEEPREEDLELNKGFGTPLRGPINPVTCVVDFAAWVPFWVTVTCMKI